MHGAVRKLAGKSAAFILLSDVVTGFLGCNSSQGSLGHLVQKLIQNFRELIEEVCELLIDQRVHNSLYAGVTKLHLGLSFKLRIRNLYGNHSCKAFSDILAVKGAGIYLHIFLAILQLIIEAP